MPADTVSPDLDKTRAVVHDWLSEYINQPHSQLGRDGAVCPFVEPSRRAESLELRLCLTGVPPSAALLAETVRCALDEFPTIEWRTSNPRLRSMVLVFPDLPEHRWQALDEAHAAVKPESVHRGLMIGQFHPNCTEKAARNPEFEVSRSPVPLVAMRMMAIHDVLFLSSRPDWFEEYRSRFGHRYRDGAPGVDPALLDRFLKASAEYGTEP